MRENINLTIHEDDQLLIEVMSVSSAKAFDPIEQDMTNRAADREIKIGNVTVRIYEP